jgi:hypothetical protein
MGFVDLFRPKYKHSDAEVRATAVRELPPEATDILATVAREDPDAAVRRIAVKKLVDPAVLAQVASEDADPDLRSMAAEKLLDLRVGAAMSCEDGAACDRVLAPIDDQLKLADLARSAKLEAVRRAALARLTDQRALAEVARNASEPALRLEALRGLTDVSALKGIALADENKEVGLAVVDRVEDRETLDAIAKRSRVKAVRARAQKKLEGMRETAGAAEGQLRARLQQLVRTVEGLSRSNEWEATALKIEEAQANWKEFAGDADAELKQRFEAACQTFFSRMEGQRSRQQAQQQAAVAMQERLAARVALCEQVEALAEATPERLEELRASWAALPPAPDAQRVALDGRFERACGKLHRRVDEGRAAQEAVGRAESLCAEAEKLLELPRAGDARRRLSELEPRWREASAGNPPEELAARWKRVVEEIDHRLAEANAEREQRKADNLARLEAACSKLEDLKNTDNLRIAERQLKEAQNIFRKPGPLPSREQEQALRTRYQTVRDQLTTRIRELREAEEWKRWSNVPKQEELCLRAEALLKIEDLKDVAQKLRAVQADWKRLGPAPRDKAGGLWGRFKDACDKAYAKCQEHFTQLEGERQENLKKKEALCEQVEAVAASEDWEITANRIKELQAEWKKVGAVPREQSDAVWKRFRKACDQFFDRRQQHLDQSSDERQDNLKKKETLSEQVEALGESTDWEATAARIKELQGEWKRVGPAPRTKSDAVWKRFRKACDHFFDRRQGQQDVERQGNLTRKEELCAAAETLAATPPADPAGIAQQLQELQGQWRSVGPAPREQSETVWQRFSQACAKVIEAYPDAFRGTDLDPQANYKKKEKLCEQLEALLPAESLAPPPAVEAGSVEEMAERLRQALAANTFADATVTAMDWRTAADEVKRIQAEWRNIGPVPQDKAQALWDRFRKDCDRVLDHSRPPRTAAPPRDRGPRREPRGERPERPDRPERAGGRRGEPRPAQEGAAPGEEAAPAAPAAAVEETPEELARREENLGRKQTICVRAEEYAAVEDPAPHRSEIRELQRQWKAIGPVPQAKAKALWNRFRRACNRVLQAAAAAKAGAEGAATEASASPEPVAPAEPPEQPPSTDVPPPEDSTKPE